LVTVDVGVSFAYSLPPTNAPGAPDSFSLSVPGELVHVPIGDNANQCPIFVCDAGY
jgi:hypothetical protein